VPWNSVVVGVVVDDVVPTPLRVVVVVDRVVLELVLGGWAEERSVEPLLGDGAMSLGKRKLCGTTVG